MSHSNLMNNYFNPNSVYTEEDFRRRFRMRHHVFERLLRDVQQVNPYFRQKLDRAGCLGDSMDETHGMSESTCFDTIQQFCDIIVQVHKDEYLREPNQEDLNWLIRKAEDCGFLGMIGSLDCMHWDLKNCPTG
ncbi:uncharacterized protein LOC125478110 [Pyrus x bretschneideri]|uniref:uncharacterized protein LOC125478110 n=1 Tax=Pyrus x bretschneideri TaxID=225117 RepID=UPI00202E8FA0|nr:uncharacterized protein LOC125478110 [Pyrus x bretschneideri]